MAKKYVEIEGKKYVRIGDKLVEVDHLDADGKPVITCTSKTVRHDDGRIDCTVIVPCLQCRAEPKQPGGK